MTPSPAPSPPPGPREMEKSEAESRDRVGLVERVRAGRSRSRKLSVVPGTEVNARPGGRRRPPYLLSKPRLYLLCNQKHFVVPSVQPNDGRMLNSSSLSLPLFKTRIKRM